TSDMFWNDQHFNWRVGGSGCSLASCGNPCNCFDVERVALHEMGHFIGLDHVTCGGAIMYYSGGADDERHTLTDNEKEGICRVYPPTPKANLDCGLGTANPACRPFSRFCDSTAECQ